MRKKAVKAVRKQVVKEVISVRMTDEEMEEMERLMKVTKRNASSVLREAFAMLCEKKYAWAVPGAAVPEQLAS